MAMGLGRGRGGGGAPRRGPLMLLLLAMVLVLLVAMPSTAAAAAAAAAASGGTEQLRKGALAAKRQLSNPLPGEGPLLRRAMGGKKLVKKARPTTEITALRGGGPKAAPASKPIPLFYPILAAFTYNLAIGFSIPVLPKIINMLINNGDPRVSPESAAWYGLVTSVDQAVTFLLVNGACHLSDKYGRKPFMALANCGLGTGQVIASLAKDPRFLLIGSAIDGMTSFSYPLAQSYIADITEPAKLPQAFGLFQGISTGGAFLVGIPIAGILAAKVSLKLPLYIAASICLANVLFITFLLPESLPPHKRRHDAAIHEANAVGAFKTVLRNPFITLCSVIYFMLHLALNGLQINWVNYSQYKYGWNAAQSSASLCLIFIFTAIFPRLLLPWLGVHRAIQYCTLLFAAGFALLGSASQTWLVLLSLVVIAAGSVSLPATLALLTNQVSASENGLINGAADTVRTLSTAVGFPLMAGLFGYFISDKAPVKLPGAALFLSSGLCVLALLFLNIATRVFDHHDATT